MTAHEVIYDAGDDDVEYLMDLADEIAAGATCCDLAADDDDPVEQAAHDAFHQRESARTST